MVEPVLGTFGEKGCTAARLAKKLTNQMNGAVITSAELEQFLQRALDDRPAWLLQIDDRWAYIDVSQRVDEPAVPEDSTDELVTSNIEGE